MRRLAAAAIVSLVAAVGVSAQRPSAQQAGAAGRLATSTQVPGLLPGTRANVFGTIEGSALSATNAAMVGAPVRLRDARLGAITDAQMTDQSGLFVFRKVDPGNYVVEMLGPDQHSVLAASQMLTVNAGDTISAVVQLPFEPTRVAGGFLGNSVPSAVAITSSAAAAGIMAAAVVGADTCSLVSGPR